MKKLAATFSLSLVAILAIELADIQNPIKYLTNNFYVEGYQYSKTSRSIDNKIVIVNIADFPTNLIKDQIEILSKYNPAAIGLDYFVPDTAKSLQPTEYQKLVLPIFITEEDSIQFSKNCFTQSASYGYIRVLSPSSFQPFLTINGEQYASLPTRLIQAYDSTLYEQLLKRNNDKEVINYLGNTQNFQYLGDLIDIPSLDVLASVKNKIVLVGYVGIEGPQPTETDTYDAHSTPRGRMFGVVLLANILHTLLGNYINPLSQIWSLTIAFTITFLNILLIQLWLIKLKGRYLIIKCFQLAQIILFFLLASFIISQFQVSIDYELFVFSVIIVPEIAFWILRENSSYHAIS